MKNKLFVIVIFLITSNAYAASLSCPPVGALYHGGPGTPWEVSQSFMNEGWVISQNPDAMNTNLEGTAYTNPLAATASNLNALKTYYFSCVYQIGYGKNNVTVVAINHVPLRDPTANAAFVRVEEGVSVCKTTLAHPENCRTDTI